MEYGPSFEETLEFNAQVLTRYQREEYAKTLSLEGIEKFAKITKKTDEEFEFVAKELSPAEQGLYMGSIDPTAARNFHRLLEKIGRRYNMSEDMERIRYLISTNTDALDMHYILDVDINAPPIMGTPREQRYANMKCVNISEIMRQF